MVNDEVVRGAIKVKGEKGGWVASIAVATSKGTIFHDVNDFDRDIVDEILLPI